MITGMDGADFPFLKSTPPIAPDRGVLSGGDFSTPSNPQYRKPIERPSTGENPGEWIAGKVDQGLKGVQKEAEKTAGDLLTAAKMSGQGWAEGAMAVFGKDVAIYLVLGGLFFLAVWGVLSAAGASVQVGPVKVGK